MKIRWKKQSGTIATTNDRKQTIEMAEKLGWERIPEPEPEMPKMETMPDSQKTESKAEETESASELKEGTGKPKPPLRKKGK